MSTETDPDALTPEERQLNRWAWEQDVLRTPLVYYRVLKDYGLAGLIAEVEQIGVELDPAVGPPAGVTQLAWEVAGKSGVAPPKQFCFSSLLLEPPPPIRGL